jgi:hypothetical protein
VVLDPAANFVRGEVNGSVASGDTTFSVTNVSIFPDPSTEGDYNAVIWDAASHPDPYQDSDVEIVRVTGRDTTNNDLTVTRAQESTSDVSHPSGSAIQMSPTAKMFTDIETTFGHFWDATNSELTADVSNSVVSTSLADITDAAQDPVANGEIRRNGTDIKAYTGGSVKNLSDIGSGGGGGGASKTTARRYGLLGGN